MIEGDFRYFISKASFYRLYFWTKNIKHGIAVIDGLILCGNFSFMNHVVSKANEII